MYEAIEYSWWHSDTSVLWFLSKATTGGDGIGMGPGGSAESSHDS